MTIREDIEKIQAGMGNWAKLNKGSVHFAHDVPHLFKLLGETPGAPRAGILFVSEVPRDEENSDVTSRVDRKYWIAVSRGYSLESYAGKSLVAGIAGGKPMFDLIAEAGTAVRRCRFDANGESRPYYKGTELLTFEGITMDAYRIEIVVAADNDDGEEA
jgi:hypothetical protein